MMFDLSAVLLVASVVASDPTLEARVDAHVAPYIETGNFSGSILVAKDGEILVSKGYGLANREAGTPCASNTAFHLASTSRIFTSAAILLLEQQGRLAVDDPISKHLPDWPRGDEITIHHLLTLSSGLPNINTLSGYGTWSRSPQTPDSLCDKFRDLPLEFEPGTRPVHSNSNYNLLALLIEKTSGLSYGEFLAQSFFDPLGMTRTAHDDHAERRVPYRATGYRPVGYADLRRDRNADIHWSVKTGNGSIYSTTEDLYRFDRMLTECAVLDESSVKKLFTEHFPGHGYGWFVSERHGTMQGSIGGRSPGFGSSWVRLSDPDVTVIVLGNVYNGVPTEIAADISAMVMGEDVEPPTLSPSAPDRSVVEAVVGEYQFGPDFYRANALIPISERGGHLFNGPSWLIPVGEMTFVHRTYWSTLTFERNDTGKVVRLRYDAFVGERED